MENKKTKLTISGTAKKSIKNIEIARTQGKNSVVIDRSKSNFVKKGSSFKSSGSNTRPKQNTSFNRGVTFKANLGVKIPSTSNDFERRKLAEQRATKRLKGDVEGKKIKQGSKKRELKLTVSRALSDEIEARQRSLASVRRAREKEQKERHQGGSKWVGTGGTSPFGAYGDHPEGVRVGGESRKRSAAKVWEQRKYRNLDDDNQLGTRQIQMALRNLRQFARTGSADELDIHETIKRTAKKGVLDIHMQAERRNRVKVLMLFDVGGSMDIHVEALEKLFSAAKNEFKTLEFFYFHNCLYDYVWKDNNRRHSALMPTFELLNKYGREYRVIFVGDASMSPYELMTVGGSVEYMNNEAGIVWLRRVLDHFDKVAWLNPETPSYWQYTQTIVEIKKLFEDKMYPMTLHGVEEMTQYMAR